MPALLQPQWAVAPPSPQHALVKAIVQLYDMTGDVGAIVENFYSDAPDVRFNDPLVHVKGRADIIGQFRGLKGAFRLAGDGVHIHSVTYGERHVIINHSITYFFRGLPAVLEPLCSLTLPCLTALSLDEKGRVLHHDDHWSVHELVGGIPVVGFLYRGLKRLTGKTTSTMANVAWAAFSAPAATTTAPDTVASTSSTIMGSLGSAAPPSEAMLAGSPSVARSGHVISSASTIASTGSGARSSIASGLGEEEKVLLAASD